MGRSRGILTVVLAVAAAAVVIAVVRGRKMRDVANATADDIEAQLGALDPVTRAAVVGKLSADAVEDAKAR